MMLVILSDVKTFLMLYSIWFWTTNQGWNIVFEKTG